MLCVCLFLGCSKDKAFQVFYQNIQEKIEREPLLRAFLEEQLFFDTLLVTPHKQDVQRVLEFSRSQLEELHQFNPERLSEGLQEHYNNLHSFLDIIIQNIENEKIHNSNPEFYSILPYLKRLTTSKDIKIIEKGLDQTTIHFEVAIDNLYLADPVKLESALSEAIGTYEFLSNEIANHILYLNPDKELQGEVLAKLSKIKLVVKDYIGFCNSKLFDYGNRE